MKWKLGCIGLILDDMKYGFSYGFLMSAIGFRRNVSECIYLMSSFAERKLRTLSSAGKRPCYNGYHLAVWSLILSMIDESWSSASVS